MIIIKKFTDPREPSYKFTDNFKPRVLENLKFNFTCIRECAYAWNRELYYCPGPVVFPNGRTRVKWRARVVLYLCIIYHRVLCFVMQDQTSNVGCVRVWRAHCCERSCVRWRIGALFAWRADEFSRAPRCMWRGENRRKTFQSRARSWRTCLNPFDYHAVAPSQNGGLSPCLPRPNRRNYSKIRIVAGRTSWTKFIRKLVESHAISAKVYGLFGEPGRFAEHAAGTPWWVMSGQKVSSVGSSDRC